MQQPARRLPHVSPSRLTRVRFVLQILQALSPRLAASLAFRLFLMPSRRELTAADAAILGSAKQHPLQIGSDTARVYEWGDGKRCVLILHGWGSRASRFAPLAAALAARGWRVLALDAPAHGQSPGRSSSLPQFMAALDAAATQFGPVQAVIGHSLGALAMTCARSGPAPQWMQSVKATVLVSMPSGAPFLADSFERMFGISAATERHLLGLFERRFGRAPAFFVAQHGSPLLHGQTLLVHDREDDIVPFAHSEQFLPGLTRGEILATAGLGHSALTRDATTIQSIGDFLEASCSPG